MNAFVSFLCRSAQNLPVLLYVHDVHHRSHNGHWVGEKIFDVF